VVDLDGAVGRLLGCIQVNAPFQLLVDRYLELFLRHGINPEIGFDSNALDLKDEVTLKTVARRLAEQGLSVTLHGPFMDLVPGGVDGELRKASARRLQQAMDLIPRFRSRSVVFHAGYDDRCYSQHREEWLAGSLTTWGPLVRKAEELDVLINLENVFEQTPEMILALLKRISSEHIGFCLDVGHCNAFSRTSLKEWLDALGPYLQEVHLHDNDGMDDDHGPIGTGTVPFEELFQYLTERRMRPVLTLEPHEEASLWKSLETLEKIWPWNDQGTGSKRGGQRRC
jgi:sugar phosphate isomerase/epimerase